MIGPGESLQVAIDRAAEGAVLSLAAGRWAENLRITKPLTLRGEGQERTLIEGREEGWPTVWIGAVGRATVRIEGLGIVGACGGCADWPRGICADGLLVQGPAEVKISDSAVSGNRRSGLLLRGQAWVGISGSLISENGHYGLWLWGSARAGIEGSTISENGRGPADGLDSARDGIAVRGSAQAEIANSIISKNGHHGLWVSDSARAELHGSTIFGNGRGGIWLRDRARAQIIENKIIDNNGYGVALYRRPCYLTSHPFSGHIQGRGNTISGRRPRWNGQRAIAVCPPELEFLMTEEGGEYP